MTLVAQANCDTWIGGVNNDFGTAGNWSFGASPTGADDACITATTTTIPQATADTYSVVLSGGQSLHSLTLGGPNGTQTLMMPANGAQLTLGADSTINANGIFTLGDTGSGDNTLCCAGVLLTNSGHLNTVGAIGNRNVRVNIANVAGGTLDIAAKNSLQDNTTTTTNNGTVTIEASGGLGLANNASFINLGGSVTNGGAFSLNGSRFAQRAGTESGTPVYFFNGSTLDDDVSAGAGLFTFLNSVDTVTGTGATPGIAAGQVLTIGAGNDTQGTLGVNLTNAGTIVMGDAGGGYTSLCCAANTLTNTGHLNTIQGGGGTHYLRVNILNASAGSIDVAATSTFQDGATTTTNNGAVTIEAGGGLGVFGPGSFINSGGSVTNNSAFSINSSAVFVERGGSESGTPVYLQTGSTLDDDLNAGAAQFIMNCPNCVVHLTGTGPTPGVAAGQVLTIPANKTEVDLAASMTNAGTIVLGDAGTDLSILCGSGVTLTNTGQLNTILGGGGASNVNRYLRVNINNATGGSIDIAFSTLSDGVMCAGGVGPAPTTITNNGTVTFEGGGLWLLSGAYTQTAGATFATTVDVNNGSIPITRMSGGPVNLDGKLKVTTVGTPLTNSRWVIIHGTIGAGRFASFNRGGIGYQIDYSSTDVTLVLRPIRPYHPVAPARILDTRPGSQVGPYSTPLGPQEARDVQVTGEGGVPAGASAVVVNVTVTNTTGASFLTVFPTGVTRPVASNLNWTAGKTVPNLVQVALGTGGKLSIYNQVGTTDVVIDVAGYIDAATVTAQPDGLYHPVVPDRVLDTRSGNGAPQAQVGQGQTITVQMTGRGGSGIPAAGVSAVVLNVTVTNATAASYLTVWPEGVQQPVASNLNFLAGQNTPNRVIVKLGSTGKVSFYNAAGSVDVIADVGGWFTDATPDGIGSTFIGLTPARILDTRPQSQVGPFSTPFGPRQTRNVVVAGQGQVPSMNSTPQPTAVVLNVTVTNPTSPSFLTVWVRLGADGSISLYNAAGSTDVIIDVVGYYN
ncbi:MAG: hypothetical protein E6J51_08275 [Chloroflexi bacterium]|nr:MAG: hypothetical protein E6J51_08275 [Chloroflexota bacterium]